MMSGSLPMPPILLNKPSISDEWECLVCSDIMMAPHLTCCGHHFCGSCVPKLLGKKCPLCNKKDFTVMLNLNLQRRLNQLEVVCPVREAGCKWKGTLDSFGKHHDECQYISSRVAVCDYAQYGCTWKGEKSLLNTHLAETWRAHTTSVSEKYTKILKARETEIYKLRAKVARLEPTFNKVYLGLDFHLNDVEWRVDNDDCFVSSPFYLDRPGYKARLRVDFAEDNISVFIQFVSGHYDDELAWPFLGSIAI